jgi:hypothetical protein
MSFGVPILSRILPNLILQLNERENSFSNLWDVSFKLDKNLHFYIRLINNLKNYLRFFSYFIFITNYLYKGYFRIDGASDKILFYRWTKRIRNIIDHFIFNDSLISDVMIVIEDFLTYIFKLFYYFYLREEVVYDN